MIEKEKIKPGDQVIFPSCYARSHGPFRVRKVERGLVQVERRSRTGKRRLEHFPRSTLVKLKPGQTVQQALRAVVPANQLCEICGFRPAPERHFVTVPVPEAFTRVCVEDMADIKKTIRERVKDIVAEVFEEAEKRLYRET